MSVPEVPKITHESVTLAIGPQLGQLRALYARRGGSAQGLTYPCHVAKTNMLSPDLLPAKLAKQELCAKMTDLWAPAPMAATAPSSTLWLYPVLQGLPVLPMAVPLPAPVAIFLAKATPSAPFAQLGTSAPM